jgi:single-stranded-DNA-specific exonuclease
MAQKWARLMIEAAARPRELQGRRYVWSVLDHLDRGQAEGVPGVSWMTSHLLFHRGYQTPEAIRAFLNDAPPEHDPYLMPDMGAAVERIRRAASRGETVAVYGDFDSDGLTASAIFLDALKLAGIQPQIVIPTRDEGHGVRPARLEMLRGRGVSLFITADCGITDIPAVESARRLGIDVIVTDHHQPDPDRLPDALVVSPTRLDSAYPWPYLSGAGVAYKVAQALLESKEAYEPLLDLAAFGTIADVVVLRDENRTLVAKGLERLRATPRVGLRALFGVAGVDSRTLDGASVGYYLGPRINAANRIADPQRAFDLITADDPVIAQRFAEELDGHNSTRQEEVRQAVAMALEALGPPAELKRAMRDEQRDPIICILGEWGTGISGLLASELTERYCVPALAASLRPDGTVAASGRSVQDVDILAILRAASAVRPGIFLGFGGHSAACGFTTTPDVLDGAFAALGQAARGRVPVHELVSRVTVDAQVNLRQVDMHALEMVESLGPYGHGFEAPTFLSTDVCLSSRQRMGADGRHLKMTAKSGNTKVSAIIFNCDPALSEMPEDQPVDIIFNIQRDAYGGLFRPQLHVRDWRSHPAVAA